MDFICVGNDQEVFSEDFSQFPTILCSFAFVIELDDSLVSLHFAELFANFSPKEIRYERDIVRVVYGIMETSPPSHHKNAVKRAIRVYMREFEVLDDFAQFVDGEIV